MGKLLKSFVVSGIIVPIEAGPTVKLTVNFENGSAECVVPALLKPCW